MKNLKIAIAQINLTVGDLSGNCKKIIKYTEKAKQGKADIVCFPELTITGYPPEDLLFKPKFIQDNIDYLNKTAVKIDNITAIIGFANKHKNKLYNSAAVIYKKKVQEIYNKMILPNYSVFDEKRYFVQGEKPLIIKVKDTLIGINICEDIWDETGPLTEQAKQGAEIILNINASPFHMDKIKQREAVIKNQAKKNNVHIIYTNLVGGQDELVFDGHSMVCDNTGKIIARASEFEEDILTVKISKAQDIKILNCHKPILYKNKLDTVYQALVLGLKDYVKKTGFKKVILGLSGGIDSALTALLAYDALGKDNVCAVSMPSKFSSAETQSDAETLAKNLEIEFHIISIKKLYDAYCETMKPIFKDLKSDITEENIQARIRGNILMAFSNKFGYLVLTTGNKSETSVGYCTLYGDMAGGFAVIKDVPKIMVYELAKNRCVKETKELIPNAIFLRPPSAELKEDQKDSDSLPDYEILDNIINYYVEEHLSCAEIINKGYDKKIVSNILNLIDKNEYKRRQAPCGIKITPTAFGKDRRMPIALAQISK